MPPDVEGRHRSLSFPTRLRKLCTLRGKHSQWIPNTQSVNLMKHLTSQRGLCRTWKLFRCRCYFSFMSHWRWSAFILQSYSSSLKRLLPSCLIPLGPTAVNPGLSSRSCCSDANFIAPLNSEGSLTKLGEHVNVGPICILFRLDGYFCELQPVF